MFYFNSIIDILTVTLFIIWGFLSILSQRTNPLKNVSIQPAPSLFFEKNLLWG